MDSLWINDNLWIIYGYGWWFEPTPLKNMSQFWMTIPNMWENKFHGPNHQPVMGRHSPTLRRSKLDVQKNID